MADRKRNMQLHFMVSENERSLIYLIFGNLFHSLDAPATT
jgi:hypothetical protein